jgi:hypothetical protein
MNYPEMQADILDEFEEYMPGVDYQTLQAMCVSDPVRKVESREVWAARNPARVRENAERFRRSVGKRVRDREVVGPDGTIYKSPKDAVARAGVARATLFRMLRGAHTRAPGFRYVEVPA